jgi:hypothetical protein
MKLRNGKKGRFPNTYTKYVIALLKFKGTIQGRVISIVVCPNDKENYISIDMANLLLIPESSAIEKINSLDKKQYKITNRPLRIDSYIFESQLNVRSISEKDVYTILGSSSIETLGNLILNLKKKFLTFSFKKKKITL